MKGGGGGGNPVAPTPPPDVYIYRVLRKEEIDSSKVFAKDPTATYTVGGHVTQGTTLNTQYISASVNVNTSSPIAPSRLKTPGETSWWRSA